MSASTYPLSLPAPSRWRLRRHVLAAVLAFDLVVAGLASLSLERSLAGYRERVVTTTRNLAQVLAGDIHGEIDRTDLGLAVVGREYERQLASGRVDTAALNRYADALVRQLPQVDAIRLTDADGILRWGSDVQPSSRIDLSDRPHFRRLRDNPDAGLVRSAPQVSRVNGKRVVVFARRMVTADGRFAGMVFAPFSLDRFAEKFSALDLGVHGSVSLLDHNLDGLYRYPALPTVGNAPPNTAVPDEFRQQVSAGKSSGTYEARYALDGVVRTSSFHHLGGHGLYVRVGFAAEDFLEPWHDERTKTLALATILILAAAGVGSLVYRSARQRTQAAAQLHQLSEALSQSHQPIVLADAESRFAYVNPAFTQLFGYAAAEVLGKSLDILQPAHGDEATAPLATGAIAKRDGQFQGRVMRRSKDGRELPVMVDVTPLRDAAGNTTGYVGAITDLSAIERHQAELEHSAQHDALTDLPNRALLRDRMQQALVHAGRREMMLAVCYLDIDDFKPINDRHGHAVGDELLVQVAQRLTAAVRNGDTVARLGGDEFVLLILDIRTVAELDQVLARVHQSLGEPFRVEAREVSLSASIGVAIFPLDESDADILLRHADKAMFAAKQAGKNRYSFFDAAEEFRATTENEVRNRIREGLAAGEFRLHYQPRVDMRSGDVVGAEALLRWDYPGREMQLPGAFLPFVENHDLIVDLGDWVLREAMRQMRTWQSAGLRMAVSVNVAARQFQQADFVLRLRALLAEFPDIEPGRLELEILESAALDDVVTAGRILDECRNLGVHLALDDFGTGYSSLTYLRRLPAHVLKIDQSFVRDLLVDPEDLAITGGVIGLARAFQRTPVAEGVESLQHGTLLLHLGCDLAQGYGIARPMPPEAIPGWVRGFRAAPEWLEAAGRPLSRDSFPLLAIEVEHRRWVGRIVAAVEQGDAALLPDAVPNHQACNFGRWLMGEGYAQYRHLAAFKSIGKPHRAVHECGSRIAALLANGEAAAAGEAVKDLLARRDEVLAAIARLREEVAAERSA